MAAVVAEATGVNIAGDFTFTFAVEAGDIKITVDGVSGGVIGASGEGIWEMP